jgi:uncharacterized protein
MMDISPGDDFRFDCHPGVACFNQCCRDLSQALTPFDVLRLCRGLGMTSSAFLDRYTVWAVGPQTGLPVVALKPLAPPGLECPFVTPAGCGVYPDRPSSCRMYPLLRGAARHRETGRITERYLLIREPHCRGFERGRRWTVAEWIAGQELEPFNRANDQMLALIAAKNRAMPKALDDQALGWIYTACYDIDRFKAAMAPGAVFCGTEMTAEKNAWDAIKQEPADRRATAAGDFDNGADNGAGHMDGVDDAEVLALAISAVRRHFFGETGETGGAEETGENPEAGDGIN